MNNNPNNQQNQNNHLNQFISNNYNSNSRKNSNSNHLENTHNFNQNNIPPQQLYQGMNHDDLYDKENTGVNSKTKINKNYPNNNQKSNTKSNMQIVPKNQSKNKMDNQNTVELFKQDSSIQRFRGIYNSNRKSNSEHN